MSDEIYTKEDRKLAKQMGENLETYIDTIDRYVIIENLTKEDYDEQMKKAKKLIKHLKNGECEKVFNYERFQEAKRNGYLKNV
jgi:hypothetical protein